MPSRKNLLRILTAAVIVAMMGRAWWSWRPLPERTMTHW